MAAKEVVTEVKTISTKLSKWEQFKLRCQLLGLWFLKNLKVFIISIVLICVILTATGVITKDTPILGIIFGNLSEDIKNSMSEDTSDIVSAIGSAASIVVTSSLFAVKIKSLALTDIKSKKIKIALVRAGMYFDENGKLTKKVEKLTNLDIDNDGKVDETPVEEVVAKEENLITAYKRLGSEFVTIIKADLSESTSAETVTTDVGLSDTASTVNEIKTEVSNSNTEALFDDTSSESKESTSIFSKIKAIFKNLKRNKELIDNEVKNKKEKTKNEDTDSLFEESSSTETKTVKEIVTEATDITSTANTTEVKKEETTVKSSTDSFLDELRKKYLK